MTLVAKRLYLTPQQRGQYLATTGMGEMGRWAEAQGGWTRETAHERISEKARCSNAPDPQVPRVEVKFVSQLVALLHKHSRVSGRCREQK
jgi:hypothetical protein